MARFCEGFDEPVQVILADPCGWIMVAGKFGIVDLVLRMLMRVLVLMCWWSGCVAERAAVCDLAKQPAFRVVLIRVGEDRHRFVLTNHHIVLDGWSLPIVLGEIFASYYGQRLPAAGSYRRFVTWLAIDIQAAHAAWREVLTGFEEPTLVGPVGRVRLGRVRCVASSGMSEQVSRAVSELARACHTTVNTVLAGYFAQVLMSLTGWQHVLCLGLRCRVGLLMWRVRIDGGFVD